MSSTNTTIQLSALAAALPTISSSFPPSSSRWTQRDPSWSPPVFSSVRNFHDPVDWCTTWVYLNDALGMDMREDHPGFGQQLEFSMSRAVALFRQRITSSLSPAPTPTPTPTPPPPTAAVVAAPAPARAPAVVALPAGPLPPSPTNHGRANERITKCSRSRSRSPLRSPPSRLPRPSLTTSRHQRARREERRAIDDKYGPAPPVKLCPAQSFERLQETMRKVDEVVEEKKEDEKGKKVLTEEMKEAVKDGMPEVVATFDFDAYLGAAREVGKEGEKKGEESGDESEEK